jgi:Ca-activated chloride channel family protein
MNRAAAACAVAALASAVAGAAPAAQIFRTGTDTVFLSVTVADGRNRPVAGLGRDDFLVFEDKTPQAIAVFTNDPQPVALSILLDSSLSMERTLALAQEAAIGFVHRLGPNDVAQIIDFNSTSETRIRQTFTGDRRALEQAIRRIQPGGWTALYDALYIGIAEAHRLRPGPTEAVRRQAVVVLSDGENTQSLKTSDDVIDSARRSDVMVYAVALRDKGNARSGGYNEAEYVLRALGQLTGGRVFVADDATHLPAIYNQIADELAHQYLIGYSSKNPKRDGGWRQIAVRVQRPNLVARTRAGYFAPSKGR